MNICDITGKGKQYGNNVSFSQRHTKKVWKPNLQTKTIVVDGRKITLKVSAQGLRTLKKKGLIGPEADKAAAAAAKASASAKAAK